MSTTPDSEQPGAGAEHSGPAAPAEHPAAAASGIDAAASQLGSAAAAPTAGPAAPAAAGVPAAETHFPGQPVVAGETQPTTPLPDHFDAQAPYQAQAPQQDQASGQLPYTGQPAQHSPQPPAYAPANTQPAAGSHPGASFGAAAVPPATPPAAPHGAASTPASKGRGGALLAGLAIGALLGGVVGGGTAAVVAANIEQRPAAVQQSGGGTLTIKNTDSATTVSGVAAIAMPSVVTLEVSGSSSAGAGSGVIISDDGYIVTNTHVVTLDGATGNATIRVKLSDGRVLDGTLVGTDPFADIAVVKVDAQGLTPIELGDSDDLNVGDLTVVIGAPLNLSNTVTSGVISSLYRGISVGSPLIPNDQNETPQPDTQEPDQNDGNSGNGFPWDFRFENPNQQQDQQQQQQSSSYGAVTLPVIQTDASINPGNSGGALLNAKGELIGINVAIASNGGDSSTAGSDGLGFAIPVNLAKRVAEEIIAGQQPSHGLLGASVKDSSQDTDEDANHSGGLIADVVKGGAADQAGLRVGDVVTAVDGVSVDSGTSLSAVIRMHPGNSEVTLSFTRGGVAKETTATLGTLTW